MSVGSTQPFRPAGTAALAASTSSVNAAMPPRGEAALITNAATGTAFVRLGTDATVSATTADMPVLAGSRLLMHVGIATVAAVVLGSGTGTVYVTRGDGTVY